MGHEKRIPRKDFESTMSKGFIQLSREFFDRPEWTEDRVYSYAESLLDLIQLAAFMPTKRRVKGMQVELAVGDICASERFLSVRWNWGRTKVRTFLETLRDEGLLNHKPNHQTNHRISLMNLDLSRVTGLSIEFSEPPNEPLTRPVPNQCRTSAEPNIIKERRKKKENKEKKKISPPAASAKKVFWTESGWENISTQDLREWKQAYPSVNVEVELLGMTQWLKSNIKKRPKSGWRRFLTAWLSRSQGGGGIINRNAFNSNGNPALSNPISKKVEPSAELVKAAYEATWSEMNYPNKPPFSSKMRFWSFNDEDRYKMKESFPKLKAFFETI